MEYISNEEYRAREGVSSSVLKKLLISDAHLQYVVDNGWQKTEATTLGDAIHAYFLEPERFDSMYITEVDTYKKAYNGFAAGDAKLDEYGKPIVVLKHTTDSKMDIKGEQYRKFQYMVSAIKDCPEAMVMLKNKEYVEASFFDSYNNIPIKVRCDFMYRDPENRLWVVDIKSVGGTKERPSDAKNFSRVMFEFGYDLQEYMYFEVIKKYIPEVYGFKFLCVDAKCPSGVKIYDIVPSESDWHELGGYRFKLAMDRYKKFKARDIHPVYERVTETINLSFDAADKLVQLREVYGE